MRTRELIKKFPKLQITQLSENSKEDFYNLSYSEKLKYSQYSRPFARYSRIKSTDTSVNISIQELYIKRNGSQFYLKSSFEEAEFYIFDNKVFCNNIGLLYSYVFPILNITWLRDLDSHYNQFIHKPSILKSILLNNIYSEETLCKAILRRCYHCKELSWKSFREFLKNNTGYSIVDLMAFTKSIQNSVNIINKIYNDPDSPRELYWDLLNSAIRLNEKVDFTWSIPRIKLEHLRQTRKLMEKEIASKSQEPLYSKPFKTSEIELLDTELKIFQESQFMHHCLYNCYFDRIKDKTYLAFHMTSPEECTIGIRKNESWRFDQAYREYNNSISEDTKKLIFQFIEDYQNLFDSLVK